MTWFMTWFMNGFMNWFIKLEFDYMYDFKKIILIANSDHTFDINSFIRDDDLIVRFNLPKKSTLLSTGQRTDLLFLANSVDVVQKKLKPNSHFIQFISKIPNTFKIVFPYSDDLIQLNKPFYKKKCFIFFRKLSANFNNIEYLSFLRGLGYQVDVMPDHYYLELKQKVDPDSKSILSTGILAADFFLNNPQYQDYQVYLHGFSFEGWAGHAWDKEKNHINRLIQQKKIHTFNPA